MITILQEDVGNLVNYTTTGTLKEQSSDFL